MAEGGITSQAQDITDLQSNVTAAQGDISATSGAVGRLSTRVTNAEGIRRRKMSIDYSQIVTAADKAAAEQAARLAGVNAERTRRLAGGTAFAVPGITDPIPLTGRPFDQSVYLSLLVSAQGYKAAGVTDPIQTVRAGDDVIHKLTPDQMIALVSQAMAWVEDVMARSWEMKDRAGAYTAGIPADYADDAHWP